MPVEIHQDYAADWGSKYRRPSGGAAALEPQQMVAFYADFVEGLDSPWERKA
ncbi:hypothetical protein D3C78_1820520 [compost metagenome]